MWPFRRKLEAPAAEGPRPVPAPVIRREWAGLPPIQRFVGAHPLTAPSDQFSNDLTTHQDPSVTTGTMGHQVSAEAPPGLVLAIARPTTRSDGPAMIPRPRVQRSVAGAVVQLGEWDGDEAASDPARPTPLPTSSHPVVATRELPVVAPEPAIQRLTSLEPGADPAPLAPVAQHSRALPIPTAPTMPAESHESFELPPVTAQRLTLGQSRRLGLGAPIKQVPHPAVPKRAAESVDTAVQTSEPIPTVQPALPVASLPESGRDPIDTSALAAATTELTRVQRAPMDLAPSVRQVRTSTPGVPPAPSVEATDAPRLDLPLVIPAARADALPEDRPSMGPAVELSATSSSAPPTSVPPTDVSPVLPPAVQRQADDDAPTQRSIETPTPSYLPLAPMPSVPAASTSSSPGVTGSTAGESILAATSVSRAAMAPLAGAWPLRPTAAIQRSGSTVAADRSDAFPPRQSARDLPLMSESEDTHLREPRLQEGGELEFDVPPQSGRELPLTTSSVLQRTSDDVTPTLTLPQRGRESERVGSELASSRGMNAMGAPETASVRLPLAPSHAVALQRASDDTQHPDPHSQGEPETVQRVWYESPVAVSRRLSEGAMASDSSGPAALAASSEGSEAQMDELARKLYDRIRGRLKSELLVDRERAGFLTDLR